MGNVPKIGKYASATSFRANEIHKEGSLRSQSWLYSSAHHAWCQFCQISVGDNNDQHHRINQKKKMSLSWMNVQPVIAALPKVQEGSAAPKTGHFVSFSILLDDFLISWRLLMLPSRRNAFMKNVDFLRCLWRSKIMGEAKSLILDFCIPLDL